MQTKYSFGLESVEEMPKWCDDYPKEKYAIYKCCFLSTRKNSHDIPITENMLRKCADTIKGTWLVAKIENGDATTHKDDEQIFGVFPREQNIEFVKEGGVVKAYAYAVVSKRYSKKFNGIFEVDNLRDSSVEMLVMYDENDNVTGFDIEGLTCLGKSVNGSCPDADVKMVRFSRNTAEKYFNKSCGVMALQNFVKERTTTEMEEAKKTYKIDKSAESMSTDEWGDIDKTELRNTIMNAENKAELIKAVYLYVGDDWENAPSEELKYPVMQLKGDTFVYNRNALASAKAYAEQNKEQSVLDKLDKIYRELNLDGKEENAAMTEMEQENTAVVEETKAEEVQETEETLEDVKAKLEACYKDIEEKDNIIMQKDKEIEELKAFKAGVEEEKKAVDVEKILAEVADYADDTQIAEWRAEGLACDKENMTAFANKLKAYCFEHAKETVKKTAKEKKETVWGFSAPVKETKKVNSLWN